MFHRGTIRCFGVFASMNAVPRGEAADWALEQTKGERRSEQP